MTVQWPFCTEERKPPPEDRAELGEWREQKRCPLGWQWCKWPCKHAVATAILRLSKRRKP